MTALLSHDLWTELAKLAGKHRHMAAAIAYVTTPHLRFKRGDLLICDASDESIQSGKTSAETLSALAERGVQLYSATNLHAKCFVIDGAASIGSANMSVQAGSTNIEAMLLTRDIQVVSLVTGFIAQLKEQAHSIDRAFLDRILNLPVERRDPAPSRSRVKVQSLHCRVWFVSTIPLTDKQDEELEANEQVQEGMKKAKTQRAMRESEIASILYGGNSLFKREAAAGDIVLNCRATMKGSSKSYRVFKPMTILHAIDYGTKRHFYLEDTDPDDNGMAWSRFEKLLTQVDASVTKPTSTKELTGNATRILQLMK